METFYLVVAFIFTPFILIGILYLYVHVRVNQLHRIAAKQEASDFADSCRSKKKYVKKTFWIDNRIYMVASPTEKENLAKIYRIKKQYHALKRFF